MRIGIDHHLGLTHAPGSGRYVRELTRALTEIEGDFGLRLLDLGRNPRIDALERADLAAPGSAHVERNLRLALPRRLIAPLARLGLSPARLLGGVDWFHSANPLGARMGRRVSCVVGELPTALNSKWPLRRDLCDKFRTIDLVFVFSTLARDVVADRLGVKRERIVVVPVGADHWARRVDVTRLPARTSPPHIIVLGVQRRDRQPIALIDALGLLARRGMEFRVSFLGRQTWADPGSLAAIEHSPLAPRIVMRSPQESEMPSLVAEASLMIHIDPNALTAVTPLEALAVGCPVIASDSQVIREAIAEHATYVTKDLVADMRAFSEHIERALDSAGDARAAAERRHFASQYTWKRSARDHVAAWRDRL